MSVDVNQYFPSIYKNVLEIDFLTKAENSLFNELEKEVNQAVINQYVITCDEATIKQYEALFKIYDIYNKDIEFRRQRILNRLSISKVFTLKSLKLKLNDLIGADNYNIYIDYENYILYIESTILNQDWFIETFITVNKMKPANIVFINKPVVENRIMANESLSYSQREYNYKIGTKWRLGMNAFKSLNYKGVVKMPEGKSIQDNLLSELKSHAANIVSYVKLNDSVTINEFLTKDLVGGKAVIEYAVLTSMGLTEVNKVELYDSNDKVLSKINLYVPILDDIELKHVIRIDEGTSKDSSNNIVDHDGNYIIWN